MAGGVNAAVALRDLGPVDVGPLVRRVEALPPESWDEDRFRQDQYDVHRATRSIRLVWTDHEPRRLVTSFDSELVPLFRAIAARFGRPVTLLTAVLARLDPGDTILRHVDSGALFGRSHRVHVPVLTNPAAILELDGTEHHLPVGRAFEVDNRRPHAAWNRGATPRVHLVLDLGSG